MALVCVSCKHTSRRAPCLVEAAPNGILEPPPNASHLTSAWLLMNNTSGPERTRHTADILRKELQPRPAGEVCQEWLYVCSKKRSCEKAGAEQ